MKKLGGEAPAEPGNRKLLIQKGSAETSPSNDNEQRNSFTTSGVDGKTGRQSFVCLSTPVCGFGGCFRIADLSPDA